MAAECAETEWWDSAITADSWAREYTRQRTGHSRIHRSLKLHCSQYHILVHGSSSIGILMLYYWNSCPLHVDIITTHWEEGQERIIAKETWWNVRCSGQIAFWRFFCTANTPEHLSGTAHRVSSLAHGLTPKYGGVVLGHSLCTFPAPHSGT